jgi:hypothetical protein
VAMLMHVGLTASSLILGPLAELGVSVLIYDLALAVAMWVALWAYSRKREEYGGGGGST